MPMSDDGAANNKQKSFILCWQCHPFFDDVQRLSNVSVRDQRWQLYLLVDWQRTVQSLEHPDSFVGIVLLSDRRNEIMQRIHQHRLYSMLAISMGGTILQ